ncbi:MAG: hypothetical protein GEU98_03685 [Pseudonocardiaceae bacterium]|nr:hypothetical protein [Pseudonocardiaceae bacterium]
MNRVRAVAGGGRAVEVGPERLAGWFARFGERHGGVRHTELAPRRVRVLATDGVRVDVDVPFGPLTETGTQQGLAIEPLVEHVSRPRRIGLLLVRLGGHSVGIAEAGRVLTSRTDRRLVHGRNSAGGWSQQRFARRRKEQARQALRAAADDTVDVLVPVLPELAGVVLGGDRGALDTVREDGRLRDVFAIAEPRVLDVREPRRTVLDDAARRARAVEVVLTEAGQ